MAVYEGVSEDGTKHIICLSNGVKVSTNSSYIRLTGQLTLSHLPSTPLDYYKEVGKGLSMEEASCLAMPRQLSPLQQELLSWHYRLYHLPFYRLFRLAELGYLPKRLLRCREKVPLCVACQFGQAHRRPWRQKWGAPGTIREDFDPFYPLRFLRHSSKALVCTLLSSDLVQAGCLVTRECLET